MSIRANPSTKNTAKARPSPARDLATNLLGQHHQVTVHELPADWFDPANLATRTESGKTRVGVDFGGSKILVAATANDRKGEVVDRELWEHRGVGLTRETVVPRIAERVQQLVRRQGIEPRELESIGIGAPGTIAGNKIRNLPNVPGFKNSDFPEQLSERLDVPVILGNDLDAAANHALGSLPDSQRLAVVYVGSGIGEGLAIDGRPVLGVGEIGHYRAGGIGYDADAGYEPKPSPLYAQRNPDNDPHATEAYLGGHFRDDRVRRALENNEDRGASMVRGWVDDLAQVNAKLLDRAAAQGDEFAQRFTMADANRLATVINNAAGQLALESLVIGGGATEHAPAMTAAALSLALGRLPNEDFLTKPTLYVPINGAESAAQGAAYF